VVRQANESKGLSMASHRPYHPDPQLLLQALLAERQRLLAASAALLHEQQNLQAQARQCGPGQAGWELDARLGDNTARRSMNAEALQENGTDLTHIDPHLLGEGLDSPPLEPVSRPSRAAPRVSVVIAIIASLVVAGIVLGMIISRQ
jgi:hypothetical protein